MTLRRAGWRRSSATLQSQLLHHLLQIVPDLPLLLRRTEEVSRVEGRHDGNAFVLAPVAAQAGDGGLVPEQGLGGELPQGDDGLRLDGRELPFEERFAGGELVLLRIAIVGRPALHRVADVVGLAALAHRLDNLGEELSGLPYERLALIFLVLDWRISHDHMEQYGVAR